MPEIRKFFNYLIHYFEVVFLAYVLDQFGFNGFNGIFNFLFYRSANVS